MYCYFKFDIKAIGKLDDNHNSCIVLLPTLHFYTLLVLKIPFDNKQVTLSLEMVTFWIPSKMSSSLFDDVVFLWRRLAATSKMSSDMVYLSTTYFENVLSSALWHNQNGQYRGAISKSKMHAIDRMKAKIISPFIHRQWSIQNNTCHEPCPVPLVRRYSIHAYRYES